MSGATPAGFERLPKHIQQLLGPLLKGKTVEFFEIGGGKGPEEPSLEEIFSTDGGVEHIIEQGQKFIEAAQAIHEMADEREEKKAAAHHTRELEILRASEAYAIRRLEHVEKMAAVAADVKKHGEHMKDLDKNREFVTAGLFVEQLVELLIATINKLPLDQLPLASMYDKFVQAHMENDALHAVEGLNVHMTNRLDLLAGILDKGLTGVQEFLKSMEKRVSNIENSPKKADPVEAQKT